MSSDIYVVLHSFLYEILLLITLLLEYSLVSTQKQYPEMYVKWLRWLWFLLHPELWSAVWLGRALVVPYIAALPRSHNPAE